MEIEILQKILNIMKDMSSDICFLKSGLLSLYIIVLFLFIYVLYLNSRIINLEKRVLKDEIKSK